AVFKVIQEHEELKSMYDGLKTKRQIVEDAAKEPKPDAVKAFDLIKRFSSLDFKLIAALVEACYAEINKWKKRTALLNKDDRAKGDQALSELLRSHETLEGRFVELACAMAGDDNVMWAVVGEYFDYGKRIQKRIDAIKKQSD
ncbi:MAG: hypothetical protein Q9223_007675, partial [Gallowayella weberi]